MHDKKSYLRHFIGLFEGGLLNFIINRAENLSKNCAKIIVFKVKFCYLLHSVILWIALYQLCTVFMLSPFLIAPIMSIFFSAASPWVTMSTHEVCHQVSLTLDTSSPFQLFCKARDAYKDMNGPSLQVSNPYNTKMLFLMREHFLQLELGTQSWVDENPYHYQNQYHSCWNETCLFLKTCESGAIWILGLDLICTWVLMKSQQFLILFAMALPTNRSWIPLLTIQTLEVKWFRNWSVCMPGYYFSLSCWIYWYLEWTLNDNVWKLQQNAIIKLLWMTESASHML